ncbi:hypothetical protein D3C71_1156330 [compost metagenome]
MARISISQAAKDFNISRNTLYKYIRNGKLTKDSDGKLDTIDLVRLFSSHVTREQESTAVNIENAHVKEQGEQLLLQQIEQLKHQVMLLENQIDYFKANEAWLKQQLDQKLIQHKTSDKKGILGRLFG